MPMYDYRWTDEKGGTFEHFASIHSDPLVEHEGRPCERTIQRPKVRTLYGEGSDTKPIEMMSVALDNDDEIADFRKRNPGTEISSKRGDRLYGVPVVKSRSEKMRVLKAEGFVEKN